MRSNRSHFAIRCFPPQSPAAPSGANSAPQRSQSLACRIANLKHREGERITRKDEPSRLGPSNRGMRSKRAMPLRYRPTFWVRKTRPWHEPWARTTLTGPWAIATFNKHPTVGRRRGRVGPSCGNRDDRGQCCRYAQARLHDEHVFLRLSMSWKAAPSGDANPVNEREVPAY
jgi:hypothetical protein